MILRYLLKKVPKAFIITSGVFLVEQGILYLKGAGLFGEKSGTQSASVHILKYSLREDLEQGDIL